MDAYIGAIWSFGFNFPPVGWALCNGQLLSIANYQALFALIGTTYGGDGASTFGVPNLQGRAPIGSGQGPGLPLYAIGQPVGSETTTLTANNLPPHTHPVLNVNVPVSSTAGESNDPTGRYFGIVTPTSAGSVYAATETGAVMAHSTGNTGVTGSNIPVNILSPFLVVNYCICLEGIFPSRN